MTHDESSTPLSAGVQHPWMTELPRVVLQLAEALDFHAVTPDIEFVAFLRVHSQFGFFRFGPVTIDVNLVEDILLRTHPRGPGGSEHPPASADYIRFSNFGWKRLKQSGRPVNELQYLLDFMCWGEGLPQRVFGELGVRPEDVERYVVELGSGAASMSRSVPQKLYSTEEAANYLGVHVQTVRGWIRSGKLPASRLAGQKSIRIRESDLQCVLEPIDPNHLDD